MAEQKETVELIAQLADVSGRVAEILASENLTIKMVRMEAHQLLLKKEALVKEIEELKKLKDTAMDEYNAIIAKAKEEAEQILRAARENLFNSAKDKEESQKIKEDLEIQRHLIEKEKEKIIGNS